MLCEKCGQREASQTSIFAGRERRLCDVCYSAILEYSDRLQKIAEEYGTVTPSLSEFIQETLAEGSRFSGEAYQFADEAMKQTTTEWLRDQISAKQYEFKIPSERLVRALRELAVKKFGAQARAVFNSWGVTSWTDFGEVVSQLQRAKVLDFIALKFQKDDFRGRGIFDDIFPQR